MIDRPGELHCAEATPPEGLGPRRGRLVARSCQAIDSLHSAVAPSLEPVCFSMSEGRNRVTVRYYPTDPQHAAPGDSPAGRGHPAHVRQAGAAALAAWRRFREAGFEAPLLAAGGGIVVEMVNIRPYRGYTSAGADGALIYVERTLRGEALASTIAHEIFHRVQYAYNPTSTLSLPGEAQPFFTSMVREGGARVIETLFAPDAMRYENEAHEWFRQGGMSLAVSRQGRSEVLGGASYQGALFWKYLAEQHGEALGGQASRAGSRELAVQKIVLEHSRGDASGAPTPVLVDSLRRARAAMGGVGHFDSFLYLPGDLDVPIWTETSWGNFQLALVLNGTAGSDRRFRFEDAARWRGVTAGRQAIPQEHQVEFASLDPEVAGDQSNTGEFGPALIAADVLEDRRVDEREAAALSGQSAVAPSQGRRTMLNPYSMMSFKVVMPTRRDTMLLHVDWQPLEGLLDGMVQVVGLDRAGRLVDVMRHDGRLPGMGARAATGGRALRRVFPCLGLSEVIIVVASRASPGDFRLRLRQAADAPLLVIGGNNGMVGREMGLDPNVYAPTWHSADVRFSGIPGQWKVSVLIQNRGTRKAEDLDVVCEIRPLSGAGDWRMLDEAGVPGDRTRALETDERCAELVRQSRGGVIQRSPPCYFDDGRGQQPWSQHNLGRLDFLYRGASLSGQVVRIRYRDRAESADYKVHYALNSHTVPPFAPLTEHTRRSP